MSEYHCNKHRTIKVKQGEKFVCLSCQKEIAGGFINNPFANIFGSGFGRDNEKK